MTKILRKIHSAVVLTSGAIMLTGQSGLTTVDRTIGVVIPAATFSTIFGKTISSTTVTIPVAAITQVSERTAIGGHKDLTEVRELMPLLKDIEKKLKSSTGVDIDTIQEILVISTNDLPDTLSTQPQLSDHLLLVAAGDQPEHLVRDLLVVEESRTKELHFHDWQTIVLAAFGKPPLHMTEEAGVINKQTSRTGDAISTVTTAGQLAAGQQAADSDQIQG